MDYHTAIQFILDNIHVIGWISIITITWKLRGKFNELVDSLKSAAEHSSAAEKEIKVVATNHLPHLQVELENLNKEIQGLRSDFLSEVKAMRQDLVNFLLASVNRS